ncbi:MAG: host specificity factor TipJ family phage tail protein [Thermodesulfobacteriota bacterium]
MLAHVVIQRDPFHPAASREWREITAPQSIAALAIPGNSPFVIIRNGEAVLRADWEQEIMDGDVFAVVVLPQGGGGGGGSNPLQVVAMLAVVAVAVWAPGAIAAYGAAGGFGYGAAGVGITAFASSGIGAGLISGAMMMGGSMLVNALIPPPKAPSPQLAQALAAPSPTYNIQAQGNTARLESAIPVQYGRMMCFPDFAASPYVEYAGNEQYLYQLLCLGQGYYDIEAIRIEDTPLSSFAEITYEVIPPGGSLTLFPANVTTSGEVSGQELLQGTYIGPFVANAAGTQANYLGIDVVMPRGLYDYSTGTLAAMSLTVQVEARPVDDNGVPTGDGSYTVLGTQTFTYKTTTPQRASLRYQVAAGRYQVRMTRTDAKNTDTAYGHEVVWAGLRAYLPETRNFGNVTLIAMRMRASNNLSSQASRKINVISTRKLPVWSGTTWSSPQATRSIAWAIADACKNTDYGAGQADNQLNLAALLALDATWSARGDEFNGRFDSALSFWEAITKIAQCGRAKPFQQGGIIHVARDQQQTIPVALFSMRNIRRGSFSVQYLMPTEETADSCEVTYFDATTWSPKRVLAKPSWSSGAKPAKLDLSVGVTSRNQAFREGVYQAASNKYRRKLIKFSTEMEGFIPSLLDLVAVAHDMPQWGQVAEVVAYDAEQLLITTSEPMVFTAGQTHYIGLRKRDGTISGPWLVTEGASAHQLYLAQALDFTPYTGGNEERTHLAFGPGETWRQPARIVSVKPRGLYDVEITCINEDVSVHSAENGLVAPPVQYSQLPVSFTTPVIASVSLKSSASDPAKALLTWTPAPGADIYQIEMAAGVDPEATDLAWTRVGETAANSYAVSAIYGAQTLIRVRGVGMTAGPWVALFYGSASDFMWTNDAALMWNANDQTLMWRY